MHTTSFLNLRSARPLSFMFSTRTTWSQCYDGAFRLGHFAPRQDDPQERMETVSEWATLQWIPRNDVRYVGLQHSYTTLHKRKNSLIMSCFLLKRWFWWYTPFSSIFGYTHVGAMTPVRLPTSCGILHRERWSETEVDGSKTNLSTRHNQRTTSDKLYIEATISLGWPSYRQSLPARGTPLCKALTNWLVHLKLISGLPIPKSFEWSTSGPGEMACRPCMEKPRICHWIF